MTSTEPSKTDPVHVGDVLLASGRWYRVHVRGEKPAPDQVDARIVTEVRHENDRTIRLAVYSDGSVRFEGAPADYPALGWKVRWVPYEDSAYQQFVQSGQ